ncbi:hypothetical protein [Flavobacterium sp.]|uniref:hypothetical protein n=1 Tax=Flavobacterium sp. TaxID=239 RepID=UPI0033402780
MEFKSYKQAANKTIQDYIKGKESNKIFPFLGIIGEVDSVIITELKKNFQDGPLTLIIKPI